MPVDDQVREVFAEEGCSINYEFIYVDVTSETLAPKRGCGGIPCSVSLNLLLKFNTTTIAQHLFISHHIAKRMLGVLRFINVNKY
jgi:hypothetical protein